MHIDIYRRPEIYIEKYHFGVNILATGYNVVIKSSDKSWLASDVTCADRQKFIVARATAKTSRAFRFFLIAVSFCVE